MMKNKIIIYSLSVLALLGIFFIGANITGFVVYQSEYNDLCKDSGDCIAGKQCCMLHPEKNLGLCMEHCMSYEFLCKNSTECENGTVCCKPEGKEYGICNKQEKCLNVDVFADYIGKMSFADPTWQNQEKVVVPITEKPLSIDSKSIILIQTILIVILLCALIYLVLRKDKK